MISLVNHVCKLSIVVLFWKQARAIAPFRAIDVLNRRDASSMDVAALILEKETHNVQELYLQQQLDHFSKDSGGNNTMFQQRYFYSDRYAGSINRTNAPVHAFLCVGGEGPSLDKSVLIDSVHCSGDMLELARRLYEGQQARVYLFALEHRYYGKSYPDFKDKHGNTTSPVTNENLIYLSSRQALADLAHFVTIMNDVHSLQKSKWVTFGGSYPGMLAAWARLEYPRLIHAAVSNSAPIQMEVDFPAYNERVSFDLQYPMVGGSSECLQTVLDGHADIVDALTLGFHKKIADLFHVCDADSLLQRRNIEMFVGDGVISVPAQGNDPSCDEPTCNIGNLCKDILEHRNHSSPIEVLAFVSRIQRKDDDCLELDWNATLHYLASPDAQQGGLRSWLWQTCTEFGFYQTCEQGSLCPYARGYHSLENDFEICEQAFHVNRQDVVANVAKSLKHYGGWNMKAHRILSVNGDVDPWSMLALTSKKDDSLPTHWVRGASHHFWTHPVKDTDGTDGQEVTDARDLIYLKVMQWLEKDDSDLLKPLTDTQAEQ